jgi:uncharacterized protein (DUF2062 family)
MPRRFFRKFALKRHQFGERWFFAPFRVVPAVALGAFFAFLPFPGHPIWASFAALALRVNIPIAALTTFISNPLTMGPMYFFAYRLGALLLGVPQKPFDMEMSFEWVTHTFVNIWQPMLLGCLLLGTASALVAYVTLEFVWRSSLGQYKSRKRAQRRDRNAR